MRIRMYASLNFQHIHDVIIHQNSYQYRTYAPQTSISVLQCFCIEITVRILPGTRIRRKFFCCTRETPNIIRNTKIKCTFGLTMHEFCRKCTPVEPSFNSYIPFKQSTGSHFCRRFIVLPFFRHFSENLF